MTLYINLSNTTPEDIVEKLQEMASNVVNPVYFRYQISGCDCDDNDYATMELALQAAQAEWDQTNNDDTPEDARNGEDVTADVTIHQIAYDDIGDIMFLNAFDREVSWTYERSDYDEHKTWWV